MQVRRDGAFGGSRVAVRDDSATTRDVDATEVRMRAMFTCSELRVRRCMSECDEPLTTSVRQNRDKLEILLSLGLQLTTCQVKRDRVTFLAVRVLQYRQVSDVCT